MDKKIISQAEFTKKVEIEAAHLMHYEYMSKKDADYKAFKVISAEFQVEQKIK